jgi:hypothetical protein
MGGSRIRLAGAVCKTVRLCDVPSSNLGSPTKQFCERDGNWQTCLAQTQALPGSKPGARTISVTRRGEIGSRARLKSEILRVRIPPPGPTFWFRAPARPIGERLGPSRAVSIQLNTRRHMM